MPESEPKPRLIELVAPGAGQGWKATLKNGKAVVIHEIAAPAAEAAAAVPRIQRLAEHPHPALAPVLAWGTDPNGLWVAAEPNEGVPLGTILSRGPLTPPAAAALGAAVLSGVAALHEAGIAMGGFGAAAIRVTSNGEVRLSGHPAAAVRGAPSQSDLRADVRSCGMAICAAFGVDPAGAPAPPSIPPGLVVTMRSMASGAMGPAADRAQGALREMASALLAPDRATASQAELALRAGGREMPAITPFLPKETYPPAPAAPQRDQTPIRAPASYEAPARPMETYPPAPAPVPPPYVPPQRRDEPAPAGASYEPPPRSPSTFPIVTPPAPVPSWQEKPATPSTDVPTWQEKPAAPSSPTETWGGVPIAPPPEAPAPPPPAPTLPPTSTWDPGPPPTSAPAPTPEPPAAEARPTWTSIPTPSSIPAADVASTPAAPPAPTPTPAPAVPSYVAPAPATYTTSPAPAPAPEVAPARKPPAPRRPVRDQATERPPWLVPAAAAIVILLLLGIGFGIFSAIRGGSNNNVGVTSPGTSPKTSPKTTPKTSPKTTPSPVGGALQTVPTYAQLASAPLTSVQFCLPSATCVGGTSADTNCTLNSSCRLDIGIYWTGQGAVSQLTYTVHYFDRCTGKDETIFNRVDTGRGISQSISWIPAPTGGFPATIPTGSKAAAIVAVVTTDKGVTAASKPYDLPGSAASCA